jgi:hypothetical protein
VADPHKDSYILELKVWLEARANLHALFLSDTKFGDRVLRAFDYAHITARPVAEVFSLIESAGATYPVQPIAGLKMLDDYSDGIKGRLLASQAAHENQLAKSETVNLLRPEHFEDFLLQSDAQFTETVLRLAPMAVQIHPRENFKGETEFRQDFLEATEFVIQSLGEGKVIFDDKTGEPRMTKPIGEILDPEKQQLLRRFIEKKRSLTKEILDRFLSSGS